MVKLLINARSGRKLAELEATGTVRDLKVALSKEIKVHPDRQRLAKDNGPALEDDKLLTHYAFKDNDSLTFKDLGPQVGWKTVFVTEYMGPLLLYPLFYYYPSVFYGTQAAGPTLIQKMALFAWSFHYGKRVFETLFIHRFSHGTMPIFNLFKNCSYYWGFAALVAYGVNTPEVEGFTPLRSFVALSFFMLFEICNGITHIQLRNLRPEGSKARAIPRGFAFELVSCPNYTFEIGAWISFSVMTWSVSALLFTLVGTGQMYLWAVGKHRKYRKEFPDYPRGRKSIFPFLL